MALRPCDQKRRKLEREQQERLAAAQRLEEAKASAELAARPMRAPALEQSELARAMSEGVLEGAQAVQAKKKIGGRPSSKTPAELQLTDDEKVLLCRHGLANGWTRPAVGGWGAMMSSLKIDRKKQSSAVVLMHGKNPLNIRKAALRRDEKKLAVPRSQASRAAL